MLINLNTNFSKILIFQFHALYISDHLWIRGNICAPHFDIFGIPLGLKYIYKELIMLDFSLFIEIVDGRILFFFLYYKDKAFLVWIGLSQCSAC